MFKLTFGGVTALGGIVLAAIVGIIVYTNRKAILTAFNPASDQNLAYKGANSVLQHLSGNPNETVGTGAFDLWDNIKQKFGASPAGLAPNETIDPQTGLIVMRTETTGLMN